METLSCGTSWRKSGVLYGSYWKLPLLFGPPGERGGEDQKIQGRPDEQQSGVPPTSCGQSCAKKRASERAWGAGRWRKRTGADKRSRRMSLEQTKFFFRWTFTFVCFVILYDFCNFGINCGLRTGREGTVTVTNNNILHK